MSEATRGQVSASAADVYDEFFVPALFGQWPEQLVEAAGVQPGAHVLDVACGTGILAQAALARVAPGGSVTGVDINPDMLRVAGRKAQGVRWEQAPAEALPFPDAQFDRVVSQFGIMFFEDRLAAAREMLRVLRPGGRLAVAVWAALADSPGYASMTELLQRLFGDGAADALRAPFCMGDAAALRTLFAQAGAADAQVHTLPGTARFPSIDAWVHTDVKGWTLADMIDDVQYERLRREAGGALAQYVGADGTVAFPAPAHVLTATKR